MKLSELRPCDACGGKLSLTFFRVTVEHHVINPGEVRKRAAMDVMFPGAPALAAVMHGDQDDATQPATTSTMILCTDCLCKSGPVAATWGED